MWAVFQIEECVGYDFDSYDIEMVQHRFLGIFTSAAKIPSRFTEKKDIAIIQIEPNKECDFLIDELF